MQGTFQPSRSLVAHRTFNCDASSHDMKLAALRATNCDSHNASPSFCARDKPNASGSVKSKLASDAA
jgi:hypothetical protein